MSIEGHIERLQREHEALDAEIREKEKRPSADWFEISDLKKRKLRIKEEIVNSGVTA